VGDHVTELIEGHRIPEHPEWVMPAYAGGSTVNLVNSLLAYFGVEHTGAPLAFHQEFMAALRGVRKIILMVFDGMGWFNIERAHGRRPLIREVLASAWCRPLTTVFPSTTSAAISSLATGVAPARHGVIGYLMYFPQYHHVFNMLNFTTPDEQHLDLLSFGFKPESYLGHPTILHCLTAQQLLAGAYTFHAYVDSGLSRMVYHDASPNPYYALGDLIAQAMSQANSPLTQLQFLYWSTLDTLAHNYGAASAAYADELAMWLAVLRDQMLPHLDAETALVLTADHGHIDGDDNEAMNLMDMPVVDSLLRAPPAGEGRAMHLFVLPNKVEQVRHRLEEYLGLTILGKEEFIALRLLGDAPPRPGLEASIGDLILLPHGSRRVIYEYHPPKPRTSMVGRHGGLSPDEMIVPLLIFRGGKKTNCSPQSRGGAEERREF